MVSAIIRGGLVVAMAVGSAAMWVGAPLFWIAIASQVSGVVGISGLAIACLVLGIPITILLLARLLSWFEVLYERVSPTQAAMPTQRNAWLRSMRDSRDTHRPKTVLDIVMTTSAALAMLAFGAWFAFFAEGGGI
ncbi:MAG: hypothetical protein ACEQSX_06205 [Baekduiaceae bacterium]